VEQRDEELLRLRRCVRDLTALSALPLIWVGQEGLDVVGSFLETLVAVLPLELAYARVEDPRSGSTIEAARADRQPEIASRAREIGCALFPALSSLHGTLGTVVVPNPLRSGMLRIAAVPLNSGEQGMAVAASRRADFPTDFDTALLGAAINQLTIWFQAARVLIERGRAEAALAKRERLHRQLEAENAYLREEVQSALSPGGIVGQSSGLRSLLSQLELVAPTEATVLILGESGTGKELVAREIHALSARADRPLVKVNCSAIPRDMFESEFFGHVRGAFTGALRDRTGRFQLANGGTIFLDEVGDLPLDLQPKLLRVLQEGQYERVGDDATREVSVRVIAATNRDLQADARAGRFREDLYYRLSVFPMQVPPLRKRKDDIRLLAGHFAALAARKLGIAQPLISRSQCEDLQGYDWPGNIRELQNVIERAVILCRGGPLRFELVLTDRASGQTTRSRNASVLPATAEIVREDEWHHRERANILAALKLAKGRIQGPGGAADLLGLRPSTLQSRLRAFGINTRKTAATE
jgi:transcriptional regulator with GAF, ATPase, and Fis domain